MTQPLFYTKASDAWKCPMYYHWRYKQWLVPREKSVPLTRGSYVHALMHTANTIRKEAPEMAEVAIGQALLMEKDNFILSEDVRDEADQMALEVWAKLQDFKVVQTEQVISYQGEGYLWKAKLDAILEDDLGGLWQGEYKTTKNYSSSLRRLYHQGIQPFIYLNCARHAGFKLKGTKMFIVSGKGCEVEDVLGLEEQYDAAQIFMDDSAAYIKYLDGELAGFKSRTNCITLMGECIYRPLCVPRAKPSYYDDVTSLMYSKEDPLHHLEES